MDTLPETVRIDLGDKRLNDRYEKIMEANFKEPTQSYTSIFKDWHQAKAVYRFFSNSRVSEEKLLEQQYKQTISHIEHLDPQEDILVLQDTTHLNYEGHSQKKELRPTQAYVKKGLKLHPSIAFTSSNMNLGLLHATTWTGKEKEEMSAEQKQLRPLEQKESYRWLHSFRVTQQVAEKFPERKFFNIADREGDIYDLLLEASKPETKNLYYIVRSSQNRCTTTQDVKLREAIKDGKNVGNIVFQCNKRGCKKRRVEQTVKIKRVELDSPKKRPELDSIKIFAVQAEEINPPKGETPIKWLILTNYPVETLDDAKKILHYYTLRWSIETFFKILKTGCKVEEIRLETLERLKKCLAVYMAVACRIMFLLKVGKVAPNLSCDILFSTSEWQVVYMDIHRKKPPSKPPTLQEMIIYIAKLGGYLNRKGDPPPGPKAMWIGIQKMHAMTVGFELSKLCS